MILKDLASLFPTLTSSAPMPDSEEIRLYLWGIRRYPAFLPEEDPIGSDSIWLSYSTGTNRILFRCNPERNPVTVFPVPVRSNPTGFIWKVAGFRSNPMSDPMFSDRIHRQD